MIELSEVGKLPDQTPNERWLDKSTSCWSQARRITGISITTILALGLVITGITLVSKNIAMGSGGAMIAVGLLLGIAVFVNVKRHHGLDLTDPKIVNEISDVFETKNLGEICEYLDSKRLMLEDLNEAGILPDVEYSNFAEYYSRYHDAKRDKEDDEIEHLSDGWSRYREKHLEGKFPHPKIELLP